MLWIPSLPSVVRAIQILLELSLKKGHHCSVSKYIFFFTSVSCTCNSHNLPSFLLPTFIYHFDHAHHSTHTKNKTQNPSKPFYSQSTVQRSQWHMPCWTFGLHIGSRTFICSPWHGGTPQGGQGVQQGSQGGGAHGGHGTQGGQQGAHWICLISGTAQGWQGWQGWQGGRHTGLQSTSQTYCISKGKSFLTVRHLPWMR